MKKYFPLLLFSYTNRVYVLFSSQNIVFGKDEAWSCIVLTKMHTFGIIFHENMAHYLKFVAKTKEWILFFLWDHQQNSN